MHRTAVVLMGAVGAVVAAAGLSLIPTVHAAPAAVVAELGAPTAFNVDTGHSSLLFKIKHMDVAWFYGRFNSFEGTYQLDPSTGELQSVSISAKAESVDTGNERRDNHLRSQDFFSAKEFETISFKSTGVKKSGEKTFDVTGDLTLHGVTKEVTIPIEVTGTGEGRRGPVSGLHTTFTIKRSDYGMNFMQGGGLGDEVTIIAGIEGNARGSN